MNLPKNTSLFSIARLFQHPIAFHPEIAKSLGVCAAVFFSQLFYWQGTKESDDNDWVWKTQEEWTAETGLSRREQEAARKSLKENGLLEEKENRLVHRMFFKLNPAKVEDFLSSICSKNEKKRVNLAKPLSIPECTNPPSGDVRIRHPGMYESAIRIEEAETTTKTTTEKNPPPPSGKVGDLRSPLWIAISSRDTRLKRIVGTRPRTGTDREFLAKQTRAVDSLIKEAGSEDKALEFVNQVIAHQKDKYFPSAFIPEHFFNKFVQLSEALAKKVLPQDYKPRHYDQDAQKFID